MTRHILDSQHGTNETRINSPKNFETQPSIRVYDDMSLNYHWKDTISTLKSRLSLNIMTCPVQNLIFEVIRGSVNVGHITEGAKTLRFTIA